MQPSKLKKYGFGKILKINLQNKKAEVVSMGHRNPQGLYYSKNFDFILSNFINLPRYSFF